MLILFRYRLVAFAWMLFVLISSLASAQTFVELYPFNSSGNLSDGGWPEAGVIRDSAGSLYGTTFYGGGGTGCDIYYNGCGTVYKVDSNGTETVLHSFSGPTDGWNPTSALILDSSGNLYGTTPYGGANGYGVIFKVDPSGNETTLYNFAGGQDGAGPKAGLTQDASGNLYGTTQYGGVGCDGQGCGTVFKISSAGQESILYRFTDGVDGASPLDSVVLDSSGNIYGTAWLGGTFGFGTVFKLNSAGNFTALYSFTGNIDGANPIGGLALDPSGDLYGVASASGTSYLGTIFEVDPAGNQTTLYTFTGGPDGAYPYPTLALDSSGNLYGTTSQAGTTDSGSVFKFSNGVLTVLYDFIGTTDGSIPMGGLMVDQSGNLYGTAVQAGTYGWGAVYEIQP